MYANTHTHLYSDRYMPKHIYTRVHTLEFKLICIMVICEWTIYVAKYFFSFQPNKKLDLTKKCPLFNCAKGGGVENCLVFAVFDNDGMIKQWL